MISVCQAVRAFFFCQRAREREGGRGKKLHTISGQARPRKKNLQRWKKKSPPIQNIAATPKIFQLQAQEILDIAMSEQIGLKGIFEPSVSLAKKCPRSASELRGRKFPGPVAALSFVPLLCSVWGVVLVAPGSAPWQTEIMSRATASLPRAPLTDRNHV